MSQLPKILLLYVHPESPNSVANKILLKATERQLHITVHDLYRHYPNFFIDVHHEQKLLEQHQIIIFQHPLYAYSCPALLKEWQDRVLTRGFASGIGGDALRGKYLRSVVTTGEPESAYQISGYHRYTIDDILRPFELTAKMCHLQWLKPLVIYWARRLKVEVLENHCQKYREWLSNPLEKTNDTQ